VSSIFRRARLGRAAEGSHALKRYGSVDDIAAMVAFVASPQASYISGANLTVDGGTNA
jgi:NAD(P)-dependent dehydrogenase (short-subunit alcohol dehydrogenase family)